MMTNTEKFISNQFILSNKTNFKDTSKQVIEIVKSLTKFPDTDTSTQLTSQTQS